MVINVSKTEAAYTKLNVSHAKTTQLQSQVLPSYIVIKRMLWTNNASENLNSQITDFQKKNGLNHPRTSKSRSWSLKAMMMARPDK